MNLDNHHKRNAIIFWLTVFTLAFFLTSCRTVKKDWLKENYVEKTELKKLEQSINSSNETSAVVEDFVKRKELTELIESLSKKTNTHETENTIVSGNIEAEAGKEKSVTVGGTKIISNGANVSFETTNTKALSKEFETKYQELYTKEQKNSELIQNIYTKLQSSENQIQLLESKIESLKNTETKEVKKKGFQLWVIVLIGIVLLLGAFWWLRKKTNIL